MVSALALVGTAAQVAAGTAVRTAAGSSINAGIWTLVGVFVSTVGVVLVAYIGKRGPWKNSDTAAREADFARLREEIREQSNKIDLLDARVQRADAAANVAKDAATVVRMQMVSLQAAFELVAGELERADPSNTVLQHARKLIEQAVTSDMGITSAMRKIATIRGTGE